MKPVERSEILDYLTYTDRRPGIRTGVLGAKRLRRIVQGPLTWLFENRDTVRYQVQEMMRVERLVRESDIEHELKTYNELLGGPGELGVTLLIGLDDEALRDEKLHAWLGLLNCLFAELPDGTRVPPTWDPRQVGTDRLSSVQYLKFDVRGQAPVAMVCTNPDPLLPERAELTEEQRRALAEDLA